MKTKTLNRNFRNTLTLAGVLACYLVAGGADADEQVMPENEQYLGQLSANPYDTDSTSNPYGRYGNPYSADSINNPYGEYGNPYSSKSATNPYTTDAPKLYDDDGNYRGRLSANPYDPESTSNPFGRYGSPYSADSINNPYAAGNPYRTDSPNNPYGTGIGIYDGDSDGPAEVDDADDHTAPTWESLYESASDFDTDWYED